MQYRFYFPFCWWDVCLIFWHAACAPDGAYFPVGDCIVHKRLHVVFHLRLHLHFDIHMLACVSVFFANVWCRVSIGVSVCVCVFAYIYSICVCVNWSVWVSSW